MLGSVSEKVEKQYADLLRHSPMHDVHSVTDVSGFVAWGAGLGLGLCLYVGGAGRVAVWLCVWPCGWLGAGYVRCCPPWASCRSGIMCADHREVVRHHRALGARLQDRGAWRACDG